LAVTTTNRGVKNALTLDHDFVRFDQVAIGHELVKVDAGRRKKHLRLAFASQSIKSA
jgi:hypothetical protein